MFVGSKPLAVSQRFADVDHTSLRCRARVTHRPRRRRQHPRQRSEGFHRALLRAAALFWVVYAAGGSTLTVAAVARAATLRHSAIRRLPTAVAHSWRAAAARKQPIVVMSSWCPCAASNGLSGFACLTL
jgi:hypothetical protein